MLTLLLATVIRRWQCFYFFMDIIISWFLSICFCVCYLHLYFNVLICIIFSSFARLWTCLTLYIILNTDWNVYVQSRCTNLVNNYCSSGVEGHQADVMSLSWNSKCCMYYINLLNFPAYTDQLFVEFVLVAVAAILCVYDSTVNRLRWKLSMIIKYQNVIELISGVCTIFKSVRCICYLLCAILSCCTLCFVFPLYLVRKRIPRLNKAASLDLPFWLLIMVSASFWSGKWMP